MAVLCNTPCAFSACYCTVRCPDMYTNIEKDLEDIDLMLTTEMLAESDAIIGEHQGHTLELRCVFWSTHDRPSAQPIREDDERLHQYLRGDTRYRTLAVHALRVYMSKSNMTVEQRYTDWTKYSSALL